jgi:hypothetical protein
MGPDSSPLRPHSCAPACTPPQLAHIPCHSPPPIDRPTSAFHALCCVYGVYPNGTGRVRQFRCLNRVIWRVLRGSHAQVYRRTRQERMPGALVRRARFNPDHDGPVCRPSLDPNLHDLGSWVVRRQCGPRPVDCRLGRVKAVSLARNVVLTMAIDAIMWSRKSCDCSPDPFRLQAVTTELVVSFAILPNLL